MTALDMEARMTLCNLATEFAAMTGIIAPDDVTFDWLAGRRYAPSQFEGAIWSDLKSNDGATFDREIVIDAADIAPMVSWGTSPEHSIAVDSVVPQGPEGAHAASRCSPQS